MLSPKEMTQKREVGSAGEAKAAILNGAGGGGVSKGLSGRGSWGGALKEVKGCAWGTFKEQFQAQGKSKCKCPGVETCLGV